MCWETADRAAAERRYAALHDDEPYHDGTFAKWAKKATPDTPYHFNDGVTITVSDRDEHPDDNFLTKGGGVIGGRPQGEGPPRA